LGGAKRGKKQKKKAALDRNYEKKVRGRTTPAAHGGTKDRPWLKHGSSGASGRKKTS